MRCWPSWGSERMTTDTGNEILSDFLMEAGELVQKLGEQLIEMERHPDDADLLNAVFRAFHTVKGGAGFLNFTEMVELCHAAEDVFNQLRSGKRALDAQLLDAVFKAVDQLQAMMAQVSAGESLTAAPASYQPFERFTIATTDSITGTSIRTPTTVASAAPELKPNRLMAAATASSKKLLAPISAEGAATQCASPVARFSR